MIEERKVAPEEERELDKEPEVEYEEYRAYAREHRFEDEDDYGESYEGDYEKEYVEEDEGEYNADL